MQTFAVVHFLNEKGKPNLDILQGSVFPEINFFHLERFEKTFRGSVVIGIAFAGHTDEKAMLQESGVLNAPIRVMNDVPGWLPMSNGHGQGSQTQDSINVARNRVTDGPSGKQIQNDRQVDETASDVDISDVGRPNLIRGCHHEIFN